MTVSTYGGDIFDVLPGSIDPNGTAGLIEVTFYYDNSHKLTIRTYPNKNIIVPDVNHPGLGVSSAFESFSGAYVVFIGWVTGSTLFIDPSLRYYQDYYNGTYHGTVSADISTNSNVILPGDTVSCSQSTTYYPCYLRLRKFSPNTNGTTDGKFGLMMAEQDTTGNYSFRIRETGGTRRATDYTDAFQTTRNFFNGLVREGGNIEDYLTGKVKRFSFTRNGLSTTELLNYTIKSSWNGGITPTSWEQGGYGIRYAELSESGLAEGIHIIFIPMWGGLLVPNIIPTEFDGEDNIPSAMVLVYRNIPSSASQIQRLIIGVGATAETYPHDVYTHQTQYGPSFYLDAPPGTAVLLPNGGLSSNSGSFAAWRGEYAGSSIYKPLATFAVVGEVSTFWEAYYEAADYLIAFDYNAADVEGRGAGSQLAYITSQGGVMTLNGSISNPETTTQNGTKMYLLGWNWINPTPGSGYTSNVLFGPGFKMKALAQYMEMRAVWVNEAAFNAATLTFYFVDPSSKSDPKSLYATDGSYQMRLDTTRNIALPLYVHEDARYKIYKIASNNRMTENVYPQSGDLTDKYIQYDLSGGRINTVGRVLTDFIFQREIDYTINITYNGHGGAIKIGLNEYSTYVASPWGPAQLSNPLEIGSDTWSMERSRYDFQGWDFSEDSGSASFTNGEVKTGRQFVDGGHLTPVNGVYTVTLYAIWAPKTAGYSLIYDSNAEDKLRNIPNENYETSTSGEYIITLSNAIPTRVENSWIFMGWGSVPDMLWTENTSTATDVAVFSDYTEFTENDQYLNYYIETTGSGDIHIGSNYYTLVTTNNISGLTITPGTTIAYRPVRMYPANYQLSLYKALGLPVRWFVYGVWTRWKRWVKYMLNSDDPPGTSLEGANSSPIYSNLELASTFSVSSVIPIHPSMNFAGWSTIEHGGSNHEVEYTAGDLITAQPIRSMIYNGQELCLNDQDTWVSDLASITLYPVWIGQIAAVYFDAGEDAENAPAPIKKDNSISGQTNVIPIPSQIPTRKSHLFLRWVAYYGINQISFEYDSDEGTFTPSTITVPWGTSVTLRAEWQLQTNNVDDVAPQVNEYGIPISISDITLFRQIESGVMYSFALDEQTSGPSVNPIVWSTFETYLFDPVGPSPSSGTLSRQAIPWARVDILNGYAKEDPSLYRSIALFTTNGVAPPGDYVIRLIGSDPLNINTYKYVWVKVTPAQDDRRGEAICYLEKSTVNPDGSLRDPEQFYLPHITNITKTHRVETANTHILCKKAEDRYIIDLGTVERYNVTLTRTNNEALSNTQAVTTQETWANGRWLKELQAFLDIWQNLTANRSYPEGRQRTGGFRFVYQSPDTTLFPSIDKNVYIEGDINTRYDVDKLTLTIPMVVASMTAKDGSSNEAAADWAVYYSDVNKTNALITQPIRDSSPFITAKFPYIAGQDIPTAWIGVAADGTTSRFSAQAYYDQTQIKKYLKNAGGYFYPFIPQTIAFIAIVPDANGAPSVQYYDRVSEGPTISLSGNTVTVDMTEATTASPTIQVIAVGGGGGAGGYVDGMSETIKRDGLYRRTGSGANGGGGGAAHFDMDSFTPTSSIVTFTITSIGRGGHGGSFRSGSDGGKGRPGTETKLTWSGKLTGPLTAAGGAGGTGGSSNKVEINTDYDIVNNVVNSYFDLMVGGQHVFSNLSFNKGLGGGAQGENCGGDGNSTDLTIESFGMERFEDWPLCGSGLPNNVDAPLRGGIGTRNGAGGGVVSDLDHKSFTCNGTSHVFTSKGGDGGIYAPDVNESTAAKLRNPKDIHGVYGGGGGSAALHDGGNGGDGLIIIRCTEG